MADPLRDLADLHRRSSAAVKDALDRLYLQRLREAMGRALDPGAHARAMDDLAEGLAKARMLADGIGRLQALREISADRDAPTREARGAEQPQDIPSFLRVPFEAAVQQLAERVPVLAPSAEAMREAYAVDRQFALVRSTDATVTRQVKDLLLRAVERGQPLRTFRAAFDAMGEAGFSASYADVVFRTNLTTAYAAGRFQQTREAALANFIVGLRYVATRDADVRSNHLAADGVIASTTDPIWHILSPPLGFNCRCALRHLTRPDAERAGLLVNGELPRARRPADAYPDDPSRFGQRPDIAIYGR